MRRVASVMLLFGITLAAAAGPAKNDAPGWLGLAFTFHEDGKNKWLHVRHVLPGSPAHAAGLRPQDVIVEVNAKSVRFKDNRDALGFFGRIRPGAELSFTVARAGARLRIRAKAAVMPPEYHEKWKRNAEAAARADQSRSQ